MTPFPRVSVPWFRGAQRRSPAARTSHSGHCLGGHCCRRPAGRGDGAELGTDAGGRPAGDISAMERLGGGEDLVVKRLFGVIWVISAVSSLVDSVSGRRKFPSWAFPSPGCTEVQTQPCPRDARLWSPGLKGSESTGLGNKLGFLFLFPPKPGREEQLPGESQAQDPHPGPALPVPAPQRSAPAGSCF